MQLGEVKGKACQTQTVPKYILTLCHMKQTRSFAFVLQSLSKTYN